MAGGSAGPVSRGAHFTATSQLLPVLWCNELGNGYTHDASNVPDVLAGGCGGALDTGRFLQFDYRGHGELFAGIGQALGLETESYGMPEVFDTAMTEILT